MFEEWSSIYQCITNQRRDEPHDCQQQKDSQQVEPWLKVMLLVITDEVELDYRTDRHERRQHERGQCEPSVHHWANDEYQHKVKYIEALRKLTVIPE